MPMTTTARKRTEPIYLVVPQFGVVGRNLDVAVRHSDRPGSYIFSVGARYYALENLGETGQRICSTG
jgi:hypothetical protein